MRGRSAQRPRREPDVGLIPILVGLAVGLGCGGLAGYRIGASIRGRRRAYWSLNVAVVLGCAALDFAGLVSGVNWLAYLALGLMGGLITGMKYGYVDSMRVWQEPGRTDLPEDPSTDASADQPHEPVAGSAENPL